MLICAALPGVSETRESHRANGACVAAAASAAEGDRGFRTNIARHQLIQVGGSGTLQTGSFWFRGFRVVLSCRVTRHVEKSKQE